MENPKGTILYIDDEAENLRGFKFLFRQYYEIYTASSAVEGFEILKQTSVQLIIADQKMPNMTGVDFFEQASELYPQAIRIILTGYSDIEAIIKAINKGKIFKYVSKPWDKDELKLIIDNALWTYGIAVENRTLVQKLTEANKQLEEANQNLERKVEDRTKKILIQNQELEQHRSHLEQLVFERTADLVKAKEKAEQSDKLKSAFLANLSHEIRTPMNAIMGFSQLLAYNDIPEHEKKEFIGLILVNSQHLLNLINEIIDISRIEAGEMTLSSEACNVAELLKGIVAQYEGQKALMNKAGIALIVNHEPSLANFSIETDSGKLRQVIVNLLENALKFTELGYIELGCYFNTSPHGQELVVYVKDTGIGIDADSTELIFERFRKIEHHGDNKLYRGAGLGLAISKRLVELMGGQIGVESKPKEGSKFFFSLPAQVKLNNLKDIKAGKPKSTLKANWDDKVILVAEDEFTNYKYIERVLMPTNINLIWAKNGKETCEIISRNDKIDLVLMDIRMPGMDGYEATRRIKEMNNNIPVIAQTAYALDYEKQEILKAGCNEYIAKPFSDKDLIEIIAKYL